MIYGAQQTIKLIRLCVFPEEGPAGGCSRPSSAPSLFEPPLHSCSLPPESPGRFLCAFLSHCVHEHTPPADLRGCCACLSWTPLTLAWSPTGCQSQPWSTPQWCSVSRTLARSLLLQTPTWGANASVAWSLVRVQTASPAVQSDILHSVCTWQVLSGESGASVGSGDCGGLENFTGAKLLLENFDFPQANKAAEF